VDYLSISIRLLLAVTFATAAASKVRSSRSFEAFADSLGTLGLLPPAGVVPIAIALVATEAVTVALLLLPTTAAVGLALAALLLAAFSVVILVVTRAGMRASCRCFGASTRPLSYPHVARNALLAAGAAFAGLSAIASPPPHPEPAGIVIAAAAALAAALLTVRFDDVVELFVPRLPSTGPARRLR
jgi:hypothetical protein